MKLRSPETVEQMVRLGHQPKYELTGAMLDFSHGEIEFDGLSRQSYYRGDFVQHPEPDGSGGFKRDEEGRVVCAERWTMALPLGDVRVRELPPVFNDFSIALFGRDINRLDGPFQNARFSLRTNPMKAGEIALACGGFDSYGPEYALVRVTGEMTPFQSDTGFAARLVADALEDVIDWNKYPMSD
jgi:hypothetical protein